MHCPKCNAQLIRESDGTLACVPGRMAISRHLSNGLTECFESGGARRPSEGPTKVASGEWFCPACGVAMLTSREVEVRCPKCTRTLNEFVYELIELHPHA